MTSRKHRHKERDTLHSSMTSRKHRHKDTDTPLQSGFKKTDTKREKHLTPV